MNIILAIALLGVLIMLHEAGHFWAARLCGIEVEEFSVGMGPLLLSGLGKKGTRFSLRLLPIGGFCRFYGEDEDSADPRAFNLQPVWKRIVTVVSGPLANFLVAFAAIVLYLSVLGMPALAPEAALVEENAARYGLRQGDRILAVNGVESDDPQVISREIAASQGEPVEMTVRREEQTLQITIRPFYDEAAGRWRVGFSFGQTCMWLPFLQSFPVSVRYNAESVAMIARTLRDLFTRGQGIDEVTGPVGTVYAIQEVTRENGTDIYLELAALISVNLGVMNLLPIPGLDGSRLLFLLYEGIRRKPVRRELEGAIHMAGFVLLMGLMVLLTYKDILRIFIQG